MPVSRRIPQWYANGPTIAKMEENTVGRDFILGDLHGKRRELDILMKRAQFDFQKDRIFSVGDLVDRGEENLECLLLLQNPWFFSVLGNHDFNNLLVALDVNEDFRTLERVPGVDTGRPLPETEKDRLPEYPWDIWHFVQNAGGRWITQYHGTPNWKKLSDAIYTFLQVPHIRVIGTEKARFHIVHAGLHSSEHISKNSFTTNEMVDENIWAKNNPYWGTLQLFSARYEDFEKNIPTEKLAPTYCGHTNQTEILRFASHINLDTGAAKGGKLTLLCHQTQEVWSTPAP